MSWKFIIQIESLNTNLKKIKNQVNDKDIFGLRHDGLFLLVDLLELLKLLNQSIIESKAKVNKDLLINYYKNQLVDHVLFASKMATFIKEYNQHDEFKTATALLNNISRLGEKLGNYSVSKLESKTDFDINDNDSHNNLALPPVGYNRFYFPMRTVNVKFQSLQATARANDGQTDLNNMLVSLENLLHDLNSMIDCQQRYNNISWLSWDRLAIRYLIYYGQRLCSKNKSKFDHDQLTKLNRLNSQSKKLVRQMDNDDKKEIKKQKSNLCGVNDWLCHLRVALSRRKKKILSGQEFKKLIDLLNSWHRYYQSIRSLVRGMVYEDDLLSLSNNQSTIAGRDVQSIRESIRTMVKSYHNFSGILESILEELDNNNNQQNVLCNFKNQLDKDYNQLKEMLPPSSNQTIPRKVECRCDNSANVNQAILQDIDKIKKSLSVEFNLSVKFNKIRQYEACKTLIQKANKNEDGSVTMNTKQKLNCMLAKLEQVSEMTDHAFKAYCNNNEQFYWEQAVYINKDDHFYSRQWQKLVFTQIMVYSLMTKKVPVKAIEALNLVIEHENKRSRRWWECWLGSREETKKVKIEQKEDFIQFTPQLFSELYEKAHKTKIYKGPNSKCLMFAYKAQQLLEFESESFSEENTTHTNSKPS